MKKAGLAIYSVLLWIFFLATSTSFLPIAALLRILTGWFDRRLVALHLFSCFWGSCYVWFNPLWRVRITGRRKIPWRKPCILVSNHQSMADIPVLYSLFVPYKWLSKKENFRVPFVGWLMRLNKYLEIERGDKESMLRLMDKTAELIRQGCSVMMFPEGTRYPGGRLGPFREGAFRMALENGADIVPVLLDGTAKALPKKGAILTGYTRVNVRVLDPIPFSSFEGLESRELMDRVREQMAGEYARMHQELKRP